MTEKHPPTPPEILKMKATIWHNWEQLPPEHRATITLVMVQTVESGEYGVWLMEALRLLSGDSQNQDDWDT